MRQTLRDGSTIDKQIAIDQKNADKIEVRLPSVQMDTQLDFQLFDVDQIENVEPLRLVLRTLEDALPEINVGLEGIGKSITPLARVPIRGMVTDDHGVAEARIAYTVDGGSENYIPLKLSGEAAKRPK